MKHGLSDNDLRQIIYTLKEFTSIEAALLYGSRAKGSFKKSSDIDLMLKGKNLNLSQLTKVMTALDNLLLPYQFDVAIYDQINNDELLEHVDRIGVDIFDLTSSVSH